MGDYRWEGCGEAVRWGVGVGWEVVVGGGGGGGGPEWRLTVPSVLLALQSDRAGRK